MADEWIAVARLLRPQGRRGELLAEPQTDAEGVLVAGASLHLTGADGLTPAAGTAPVRLAEVWEPTGRNAGRVVLKLEGCDSITDAELLAGKVLLAPLSALPALEPDSFYVRDLLGCMLVDHGVEAGEIVDVEFAASSDGRRLEDAAPLLGVRLRGQAEADEPVLVPFVRAYLRGVDLVARRVEMELPDGLLGGAEIVDE